MAALKMGRQGAELEADNGAIGRSRILALARFNCGAGVKEWFGLFADREGNVEMVMRCGCASVSDRHLW